MRFRFLRMGTLCLLLAGCAGLEPVSQREMEARVYESSYDLVYNATLSVLTQRGHEIVRADEDLGVIETGVLDAKYKRVRTKVEVKPLGKQRTQVRVAIYLEERGVASSTYKPAPAKMTMYDDLFEEIDLQIYRERFLKIERKSREKQ